jgi:hypothetical protein
MIGDRSQYAMVFTLGFLCIQAFYVACVRSNNGGVTAYFSVKLNQAEQ